MPIQTGNTLKTIAFWLLCIAILEKNELMTVIPILIYGLGIMLVNVGIAKIQSDIEENERKMRNDKQL